MRATAMSGPTRQHSGLLGLLDLESPEFESRVGASLDVTEERLRDCVLGAPEPGLAAELSDRLAGADEGRLRPLLVLLGAEFGESWREGVTEAAVMVELLHLSSVADAHRSATPGTDWLLARSAQLAAGLGTHALQLSAQTVGRLAAGQLRQLAGPAPEEEPVAHYFEVTAGRTAALLALSLGMGALQAGAPDRCARALIDYGEHLGVALRIADDLIVSAPPAPDAGDAPDHDPFSGAPGLPVLLARSDTTARGAELRRLLTGGAPAAADRRRAREMLRTAPATRRARAALHGRLAAAVAAVGVLPSLPARRALYALCDFVAARTSRTT